MRDDQLIHAIAWLVAAREAPRDYAVRAHELLAGTDDPATRSVAHAVLARCSLEQLDARAAVEAGTRAVEGAPEELDPAVRAELAVVLAAALTASGRLADALATLSAAEDRLGGEAAGVLAIERCHLHYREGQLDQAFAAADRALLALPDSRPSERARAFNNRGVTRLYLGGARLGLADLEQAERLFRELGRPLDAADAAHNRGMMLARLGDLPAALATFDRAERTMTSMGLPIDIQLVARAEVLVLAGLVDDVVELMPPVVDRLEADGMHADAAEGRLYLAMARLATGDRAAVADAARTAEEFRAGGREGWALLADDLRVQAELLIDGPEAVELDRVWELAERLDASGMRSFAGGCWLRVAEVGERRGDHARTLAALDAVAARRGTLSDRVLACEAAGRRALLLGDARQARRVFERGLRLIERNRSLFEATELRIEASAWGERMARRLVDLAWSDGEPDRLLDAAERWRATALATRPPLGPPDDELVDLLADYRAAHAGAEMVVRDAGDAAPAAQRLRAAEAGVVNALRRRSSATPVQREARVSVHDEVAASPGRVLLEFVEAAGRLGVVVVDGSSRTIVELGAEAPVAGAAEAAHRALRQLAPALGHASARLLHRSAVGPLERLVAALHDPVRAWIEPATEVVVVPVGSLHLVPWGLVLGRPVAVTPSARSWVQAGRRRTDVGGVVVVAGPGLDGAAAEAAGVSGLHPGAVSLTGEAATARRFLDAAEGARLVHVACHARYRADNALFSALQLHDGPVTGFELERLPRAPAAMVLSACSTGRVTARAGGELLGLATVSLAAGTAALVTSLLPLPDAHAVPVLEGLHRALLAGATMAEAVRGPEVDPGDPAALVIGAALACYGRADWRLNAGA